MANRVAVDNVEPDPESKISGEANMPTKEEVKEEVVEEIKVEEESKGSGEGKPKEPHRVRGRIVTDKVRAKAGKSVLSAFLVTPSKISFKNENDDEEIILLLRAHPVTNVPWIIIAFLLLLIPFIVIPIMVGTGFLPIGPGAVFIMTLIWIMGVFSYSFLKFLYWYFNVYIVTTQQIIDIDWYNIVYKAVSATLLDKVQDVTSKQGGVMAGVFDFGDVIIQTAGTEENFEFTDVPHPQEVAEEIQELMTDEGAGKIAVDSVGGMIR